MSAEAGLVFYIAVFGISSIFLATRHVGSKKKVSIFIGLAIPILLTAFRGNLWGDATRYVASFWRFKDVSWNYMFNQIAFGKEFGFAFLKKIAGVFGGTPLFLGSVAALTLVPVVFAVRKQYTAVSVALALFLYFTRSYIMGMHLFRQFIAIALVFWGFQYIFKKDIIKYALIVFLASSFHVSALLMAPLYFLWDKKKDTVTSFKAIVGIVLAIIIVSNFTSIVSDVSEIDIFSKYGQYATENRSGNNRDLPLRILILGVILLHKKELMALDKKNNFMFILTVLALLLTLVGVYSPSAKRLVFYLDMGHIVLLPQLPVIYRKKGTIHGRIATAALCLYGMAVCYFTFYYTNLLTLLRYSFA